MVATNVVTLDHSTHSYFIDGVPFQGPSVTQALCQCGLADYSFMDEETRQSAMTRGTSVHWACALFDQGALNPRNLPLKLRPYVKAYKAWRKNSGFVPDLNWIERSFVSPFGYCGTIDRVGTLAGFERVVVDLKSGSSIHPATRYQLCLYANHAKVYTRLALRLGGDGTYTVKPYPFSEYAVDLSIAMESVRRWRKE